ncbi:MAG: HAMP domain-containing protein [Ideonella sp.]|nr:HAMP domain-containing protein [Ideonella sp.]
MTPHTLFGRMVLVIALVSIALQALTIAAVIQFALLPLGRQATDDLAALMLDAARSWHGAADDGERAAQHDKALREHRLHLLAPMGAATGAAHLLPYWHLLETALAARSGEAVALQHGIAADGERWVWADLPTDGAPVRVGFTADRVVVQPSLALLLALAAAALVTLATAAAMARGLVAPLQRLVAATEPIGQGRRAAPLPETGPDELARVARAFNRMGEQVEELLANRTTLLAGISHDLRSPLARMRLALGMLSERPDRDLLQRVLRDVDAMNDLIARCLEAGRDFSERDTAILNLGDLLREVAAEHGPAGVEVRVARAPECRLRVRPLALRRIVSNLVDNAIRYGGGHPVEITCAIAGERVQVCVLDRGPGIPESAREAVFRPFHRLEASRSSRTGGSGLGLAIVRQLASTNGWSVELQPRAGGGTAACLRMPLEGHYTGPGVTRELAQNGRT